MCMVVALGIIVIVGSGLMVWACLAFGGMDY